MMTDYGRAYQRKDGYWQISSGPNQGKLLHRLIYEEHYGPIPEGFHIHHLDNDKTNCSPENLLLLSKSNHHKLHMNKTNHPRWDNGLIDKAGGVNFLSAEKNKGRTMQEIVDDLGYSSNSVAVVFQYLNNRGLRWNQI